MKHLDTERLRTRLDTVFQDVEQIMRHLSEATGEQVDDVRSRTSRQLHDARDRLGDIERATSAQLRSATRQTRRYASKHPWQLAAGFAMAFLTVAALTRKRRRDR